MPRSSRKLAYWENMRKALTSTDPQSSVGQPRGDRTLFALKLTFLFSRLSMRQCACFMRCWTIYQNRGGLGNVMYYLNARVRAIVGLHTHIKVYSRSAICGCLPSF